MLDPREPVTRLVIPRWLRVSHAVQTGELSVPRTEPFFVNELSKKQFSEELALSRGELDEITAAEMMGGAVVLGRFDVARELATGICQRGNLTGASMTMAQELIGHQLTKSTTVNAQIAWCKKHLSSYPRNSVIWMEVARLYTIKGQLDRARRAVEIAVNLAPHNRYIVRATARFFIHVGELDAAWKYLERATQGIADPWVKATWATVGVLLDKDMTRIRRALPKTMTPTATFHFSELIESSGVVDLMNGNEGRARKLFKRAWENPSANVVTHAEWVLRTRFPGLAETTSLDFVKSMEAQTWRYYSELRLNEAVESARQWILEEPYSPDPYTMASCLMSYGGKPAEAAICAGEGLVSNPHNFLLRNNRCFALLRSGQLEKAITAFAELPQNVTGADRILRLATGGLLEYHSANRERGKELYLEAIDESVKLGYSRLAVKARLHLAIAEVEQCSEPLIPVLTEAWETSQNSNLPDIILLRRELSDKLRTKGLSWIPD